LSYWTFSDTFEEGTQADNPLYGGFRLQTIHGIRKHAYRLQQILPTVGDHSPPFTLTGAPATVVCSLSLPGAGDCAREAAVDGRACSSRLTTTVVPYASRKVERHVVETSTFAGDESPGHGFGAGVGGGWNTDRDRRRGTDAEGDRGREG
jgi:hypothetical protein